MILEGQTSSENSTSWYLLPPSAESKPGGEIPTPITRSQQAGRERCGDPAWSRLPRSRRGSAPTARGGRWGEPVSRLHDVRAPPRPGRQHPPTGLSRTRLQQAHENVRRPNVGAERISLEGRAKDDGPARPRRRGRAGDRRQRQRPHRGGGGRRKTGEQPHALGYAPGIEMPRPIEKERATVPIASGAGS